ncbi:magnesium and cobalt transport protein CorA [Pseudochelatococcus contaminans]|uniref:Magnesium transporter n=1 Tax=Pseudochelatococcus contaminans TaxID=1538103 RepID=A0A7W5Z2H2_9HYPH|nr:magnesium and cobalt transport protein CorA [Pseudochelatococcus contaminans]MBB3808592.1 magnesium transporter [Pseudochelatococcus contaminans]
MTCIAAYLYRNGKRQEGDVYNNPPTDLQPGDFVWIGLLEPTAEEMTALQKTYNLHPLAVADSRVLRQLPKVDVFGDQLFVIAKTAHLENDRIYYGQTAIFVGEQHIITVRQGSARMHSDLRAHLEDSPQLLKHGPDYVLYAILDFIVNGYVPTVQTIEDSVLDMERHMLSSFLGRDEIARLFHLRRQLILFQRILGPMSEVTGRLATVELPVVNEKSHPFFKDVQDHVKRVETTVEGLREIMISVFEASNLFEQQRQGDITRKLAAWAAILAVPTAIAGIYGMNFDNMPELHLTYGYYYVLCVIVILCSILYWRFKKSGWL